MRKQNERSFYREFFIALITVILTSIFNYLIFFQQNNKEEKLRLNENLNKLLDIKLQYPFVEDSTFTAQWSKNPNANNDSSLRYQTYCIYLLNFVQDVCDYYGYKKEKIDQFIDMNDLIEPVRAYWRTSDSQKTKAFPDRYNKFIDDCLR